jgi:hypothetical protein
MRFDLPPTIRVIAIKGKKVEGTVRNDDYDMGRNWIARLVDEIGRAAQTGWPETARMIVLLAVAAGAIALILTISR